MKSMLAGVFALFVCLVLLSGCAQPKGDEKKNETVNESTSLMNESTAREKLAEANCWYELNDKSECLVYEKPYWVAKKELCGGTCKVNEETGEVTMDVNQMCMGLLVEEECTTDADCAYKKPTCPSNRYACINTSCVVYSPGDPAKIIVPEN
ncbi:MAG: hypothetical protein ABIH99_00635 [Candidatus Micrarchaeota archaeon]